MYQETGNPSYFCGIGFDNILMAANDNIAHGALPILYMDEIAAGQSE